MKTLTVRQPHAGLVALNLKSIETRSWSTKHRGPLLIHAGATPPKPQNIGPWRVWNESGHVWWLDGRKGDPESNNYFDLPLGAIVASCKLVDCVPIIGNNDGEGLVGEWKPGRAIEVINGKSTWAIYRRAGSGHRADIQGSYNDQLPYGDFTHGRFAWLLEDIQPTTERCPACWGYTSPEVDNVPYLLGDKLVDSRTIFSNTASAEYAYCQTCKGSKVCEPIPAKGKQGLWNWEP